MNYYETLYIVHPALESGRLKDIILSLEESLNKLGGKTLSIDLWGKKKLAYLIDKQKYGTYVQLQFTGEGNCTSSFGLELEHNPNVMSYLTTLIEESDVVEQENDLDTQIAGHSREAHRVDDRSENTIKKNTLEDEKSSENEKDTSAVIGVSEEVEGSVEEPAKTDNDMDVSDNKSETKEVDTSEQNTDIVKENKGNADIIAAVSEEE